MGHYFWKYRDIKGGPYRAEQILSLPPFNKGWFSELFVDFTLPSLIFIHSFMHLGQEKAIPDESALSNRNIEVLTQWSRGK